MSKIAFIHSDSCAYNITRALSLIKSEVMRDVKNASRIVVKPNCFSDQNQDTATHPEALWAVLNFISPFTDKQIVVAEGVREGDTLTAFKNYDYLKLQDQFGFAIVDLNTDDSESLVLFGKDGKPFVAKFAATLLNADYVISLSFPQTHQAVVYSGVIENLVIGGLLRPTPFTTNKIVSRLHSYKNHKSRVYPEPSISHDNIVRVFERLPKGLAILDGFTTLAGDSPQKSTSISTQYAAASSDFIAIDQLGIDLMGIDQANVGYLSILSSKSSNRLMVGDQWSDHIRPVPMSSNFETIRHWR